MYSLKVEEVRQESQRKMWWQKQGQRDVILASFEDGGRGPGPKECGGLLEAENAKKVDSILWQKGTEPC
jgi:hypothetical protein